MFDVILIAITFILSLFFVSQLRNNNLVDTPNERSSHEIPTATGGGLGFISVLCGALSFYYFYQGSFENIMIVMITGIFMMIGLMDDKMNLSASFRLIIQFLLVAFYCFLLSPDFSSFNDLIPIEILLPVLFIGFVWFINLYNFMDGIDGITSIQSLWILIGLILFGQGDLTTILIIISALLGFLWWNFPPAKIFMGDSGSIPLGFLIGVLLIENASLSFDHLLISIILPLYYIMDATITLVRRLLKGHKPWEAHKEHFYQAQTNGDKKTHKRALIIISVCNAILIIWAALIPLLSFFALIGALLSVLICLWRLKRP